MNKWLIAVALVLVIGCASTLYAEQPGTISQSRLSDLGLSGMQTVSDQDGLAVRGKGFLSIKATLSASSRTLCDSATASGTVKIYEALCGCNNDICFSASAVAKADYSYLERLLGAPNHNIASASFNVYLNVH